MFVNIKERMSLVEPDIIKYQSIVHNISISNVLIQDISIMMENKIDKLHAYYQDKLAL